MHKVEALGCLFLHEEGFLLFNLLPIAASEARCEPLEEIDLFLRLFQLSLGYDLAVNLLRNLQYTRVHFLGGRLVLVSLAVAEAENQPLLKDTGSVFDLHDRLNLTTENKVKVFSLRVFLVQDFVQLQLPELAKVEQIAEHPESVGLEVLRILAFLDCF